MNKQIIPSLLILLFVVSAFSQDDKKVDEFRNEGYFNITRFSYINVNEAKLETYSPIDGVVVTDLPSDKAEAYSLQTINGYFFGPHFSVGIGVGLDGYHNPNFNTLPAFLDLRVYLNDEESSMYLYTDIGSLIKIENGTKRGTMFNIGLGYKLPINKKRLMIVTDLSFCFKKISNDGERIRTSDNTILTKGIMLSLGVIL